MDAASAVDAEAVSVAVEAAVSLNRAGERKIEGKKEKRIGKKTKKHNRMTDSIFDIQAAAATDSATSARPTRSSRWAPSCMPARARWSAAA